MDSSENSVLKILTQRFYMFHISFHGQWPWKIIQINTSGQICKYSNHLNTGLVWYSNGRFVSGFQIVWYSNGGLKTGPKMYILWSKMSGFQMVCLVTWQVPSEHQTFKSGLSMNLVFRGSVFRCLLHLDPTIFKCH